MPTQWVEKVRAPLNVEKLVASVRSVEAMMETDPLQAREGLRQVVESVVLDPNGPDGDYQAAVTLRSETAALAGGRPKVSAKLSCGDRI